MLGHPLLFRSDNTPYPAVDYSKVIVRDPILFSAIFSVPALAHLEVDRVPLSLPAGMGIHPPYSPPPLPPPSSTVPPPVRSWQPGKGSWTDWIKSLYPIRRRIRYLKDADPLGQEMDLSSCLVLKGFLLASLLQFHRWQGLSFSPLRLFRTWDRWNLESEFAPLLKKWLAIPCALSIDRDRRVEDSVSGTDWLILISPESRREAHRRVFEDRDVSLSFGFQRVKTALPPLGPLLQQRSLEGHGKILSQRSVSDPRFLQWVGEVVLALFPQGWAPASAVVTEDRVSSKSSALCSGLRIPRSRGGGQSFFLHDPREEEVVTGRWVKKDGSWSFEEEWRGQLTVRVGVVPWTPLTDERRVVQVVQVPDPLKARTVTICNVGANVLRPLQHRIHSHLRVNPIFQLIGRSVDSGALGSLLASPLLNSADYSAATDGIFSDLTECAISHILDRMDWEGVSEEQRKMVEEWSVGTLVRNVVQLPNGTSYEQGRGQLMGSLLSFPILCIINFAMWSFSQFSVPRAPAPRPFFWKNRAYVVDSRGIPLKRPDFLHLLSSRRFCSLLPVRINGDDLVSGETEETMASFEESVALMGCTLSVGKSFVSSRVLTINSTLWIRERKFSRLRVPNWSALYRSGFLDGSMKRTEWEETNGGWSSLLMEWISSWPPREGFRRGGLRWKIFKEALQLYRNVTLGPESIGFSGIFPRSFHLRFVDRVRLLDPSILMDCPPFQARVALEILSTFADQSLPPGGIRLVHESDPQGLTPDQMRFWRDKLRFSRMLAGKIVSRLPEPPLPPDPIVFQGKIPSEEVARTVKRSVLVPEGSGLRRTLPPEVLDQPDFGLEDLPLLPAPTPPPPVDRSQHSWWKGRVLEIGRVDLRAALKEDNDLRPPAPFSIRATTLAQFGSREICPLDNEEWLFVSIDPDVAERVIQSIVPSPHPMRTREKFRSHFKDWGKHFFDWTSCSLMNFLFTNFRIQCWTASLWKEVLEKGAAARLSSLEPEA